MKVTHLAAPVRDGTTQRCARCGIDITPAWGWWPFNHAIVFDDDSGARSDAEAWRGELPPPCEGTGGPAPVVPYLFATCDGRLVGFAILSEDHGGDREKCKTIDGRLLSGAWMATLTWPGIQQSSIGHVLVEAWPKIIELPTDRLFARDDLPFHVPVVKLFQHRWHPRAHHAPAVTQAGGALQ